MDTKCVLLATIILISITRGYSQDESGLNNPKGWKAKVGAEITSRYIWRGISLSKSAAVQPTIEVSNGSFGIGTWGSWTIAQEPLQETDLYAYYSFGPVTVTVYDYSTPYDTALHINHFFNYKKNTTGHVIELIVSVTGGENFPMTLTAGSFIYGADKKENSTDNNYSTYLELSYSKKLSDVTFKPFIGCTTHKGYYASQFGVVNMGFSAEKEIEFTDKFKLPVKGVLMSNPDKGNIYLTFSFIF